MPSLDEYMENNYGRAPLFLGCDIKTDFPVLNVNLTNNMSSNDPSFQVWTKLYTTAYYLYCQLHYSFLLNTSTFRYRLQSSRSIPDGEETGYNVATAGNDSNYSACVGCAILKRNLDKHKVRNPSRSSVNPASQNIATSELQVPHNFHAACHHRHQFDQHPKFEVPKTALKCKEVEGHDSSF